jgi:CheY-like chemotaxis protein
MKRILLIEDNLEIRENTSEILELEGYEVITAANGKIGLDLARKNPPDLILCDILMPEMTGYEVFEHLKMSASMSIIPFIFITASAEKSEVQLGLNMGAAGYVRKPFQEKELLYAVDDCLKGGSPE